MVEEAFTSTAEGHIIIEERKICTTEGVLDAIVVLFATFYIFDIAFSKHAKNTLVFIQKYLLGCKDRFKTPNKVNTIISKLNSLME